MGGGPLGAVVSLFSAIPSYGRGTENANPSAGSGSQEDPYGALSDIDYPVPPDVTFQGGTTTTNPINIPAPGPAPGPSYPPTLRGGLPGPDLSDRIFRENAEILKERRAREAKYAKKGKPPGGGGGKGEPFGEYGAMVRACLANPVACIGLGVLFPSPIGDATLTPAEQKKIAAARKRSIFYKEPRMPSNVVKIPKRPALGTAMSDPLARLETPKPVKITAKRMKVETPKAVKITAKRLPAYVSPPGYWTGMGKAIGNALLSKVDPTAILFGLAQPRTKTQPQAIAAIAPTVSAPMPLTDPLTPVNTPGVASPLAGGSFGFTGPGTGSIEDQCRNIRKRKKPKRRCIKRDDCNRCIEFEAI